MSVNKNLTSRKMMKNENDTDLESVAREIKELIKVSNVKMQYMNLEIRTLKVKNDILKNKNDTLKTLLFINNIKNPFKESDENEENFNSLN